MSGSSVGARLALPFAVFLGLAEVVRNWGAWGAWPFWVVDYIAVGLLLWAWWAVKSGRPGAHVLLAGAWGFTCAMFYLSFFSHLYSAAPPGGPVDARVLTIVSGALFAVTVVAFVSTLVSTDRGLAGSRVRGFAGRGSSSIQSRVRGSGD